MTGRKFLNFHISHHWMLLWIVAFMITVSAAAYQRLTGPTYPMRGKVIIDEDVISFKLLRVGIINKDVPIILNVPDRTISGRVRYQRYKSYDAWSTVLLQRGNDSLKAYLPHQPAAGKLIYFVYLEKDSQKISLTGDKPVILRYRGSVPATIMIPHILLMFIAMLFSNRAGLEALDSQGHAYKYMLWTIALFFIGGFIFGPLMQKFAFGDYWTGIPFGYDLTDNKSLIAMVGWIWAWMMNRKGKNRSSWIIFSALLMLAIYLIPHSVLGSELDYKKLP